MRACLDVVLRARAERRETLTVVVFFESVLEAVAAVAACAVDALGAGRIDKCFTRGIGALLVVVVYAGFGGGWCRGVLVVSGFLSRPFAFFGTLVRVFCAVIEAEFPGGLLVRVTKDGEVGARYLPVTTLAAER